MARFETKFISKTLLRSVELTVIIPSPSIPEALGVAERPASYEVRDPYPVLYLLHGLGNDHSDWTSYTNVELFAEEQSMAVVMMSAEINSIGKTEPEMISLRFFPRNSRLLSGICFPFPINRRIPILRDFPWAVTAR